MHEARTFAAALLCAALAFEAGPAWAQPPPATAPAPEEEDVSPRGEGRREGTMAPRGWFGMVGANFAFNFSREPGSGFAFGAEGSVARITPELFWAGAYLDALFAVEAEELRLSIGPELGYGFAGFDVGYVLALGGRPAQHGVAVRPLLTFGIAAIYFRSIWLFGTDADWSGEVGLLLKAPIEL
jgi:hypothetical protein